MRVLIGLIFLGSAILEVGGDATVRVGLRGNGWWILVGVGMLGCYGILVNMVKWDFSRLLGTYIAVFALVSVLCGHFIFKEPIPSTVWMGLLLIGAGGVLIQFGR